MCDFVHQKMELLHAFFDCLLSHKWSPEDPLKFLTQIEDIEILIDLFRNKKYIFQNFKRDFLETVFFNSLPKYIGYR